MIELRIDYSGVMSSFDNLKESIMGVDKMGKVMQLSVAHIWIPKIKARLGEPTGTSGYQQELDSTMRKLDESFVGRLSGNFSFDFDVMSGGEWADRLESDRRAPGGYSPGEITRAIDNAIKASAPINIPDGIAVGVGELNLLNNLFPHLGVEKSYRLWQILNYGSGSEGASGSPVVRTGKQVFYDRKTKKGVLAYTTVNPGFKGREFFVKMDGSMHEGDYMVKRTILRYINNVVKQLSYRK